MRLAVTAMSDVVERSGVGRARVILTTALLLLFGILVALLFFFYQLLTPPGQISAAAPTEMRWVRSLYGFGPAADEQLKSPTSVAIAPNGDIYATDPSRSRVMIFRPDGTFRRLLHTGAGGVEQGQFIRPESIDIDEAGLVYIADSWAGKVIVFDAAGAYVREWIVGDVARGVHVSDGKVYVMTVGRVLVYDDQGRELMSFGSRGREPGQIDAYQGVVANDGVIYIADSYNRRVQAFAEDGSFMWAEPSLEGTVTGLTGASMEDASLRQKADKYPWELPQDITLDGKGRLVAVDAFRFRINVVDPQTGEVLAHYGDFGRGDGQFFYPTSIAYDPDRDWFAVADTQNNRVQIVTVPDSGADDAASVWRALSSPYRFLGVPALVLAFSLALWWLTRALLMRRLTRAEE